MEISAIYYGNSEWVKMNLDEYIPDMTSNGNMDLFMGDHGGWAIPRDSRVGKHLRKAMSEILSKYGHDELIRLYHEDGVYNFYVQQEIVGHHEQKQEDASSEATKDANERSKKAIRLGNGLGRMPSRP